MIKSILLPIDGSIYSETVLQYGIFLAKKFKSVLRVVTIVDIRLYEWNLATGADTFVPVMPSTEFQEESQRMQDDKADMVLEKADKILNPSKLHYELIKTSGIPVDEILSFSKTNDLVIMGIRGEYERWSNSLLGATVEAVTRQINKPVLLAEKNFEPFKRIHCGYDGSNSAIKALQFAAYIAASLNLMVQILAVFDEEEEREAVLKEAEKYISPYNIDYQLRHETGDGAEVLINAQNSAPEPSLIIIGSYGRSRLREAILGSTTVQVMRKANKPVLLAK